MKHRSSAAIVFAGCLSLVVGSALFAGDWPQWRGPSRDAHAPDFAPPQTWPDQFNQKWKATVGQGVSTPALVGDRVYAFGRIGNQAVATCLEADTGKPVWQDKYEAKVNVTGPAASYSGPRSSPAVADGKVVTLDEGATLSCLDAATGKVVWRKDFAKEVPGAWPRFYTAMSPLIVDGMCIAHFGGSGKGVVFALDLVNGETKWKWDGEGPAYASPAVMTVDGVKQIVQETERSAVGLGASDGKLLWQIPFGGGGRGMRGAPGGPGGGAPGAGPGAPGGAGPGPGGGRPAGGGPGGGRGGRGGGGGGMAYNAASPVVDGQTVILSAPGQGTKAFKIERSGEGFTAKELWANAETATQFNTPVLKDGKLYGISSGSMLFCIDVGTGKTLWTSPDRIGDRGFGSVVAAGPVLLALTPASELVVFQPDDKAFKRLARVRVADTPTGAYPVAAGKRLYIRDRDSVIMYTID